MDYSQAHMSISQIESIVEFSIDDPFYYLRAFVHKSIQECISLVTYPVQEYMKESNERLEFLGDAMFSAAVTDYLFERFHTGYTEGDLSKMRVRIVNGKTMAHIAECMGINKYIFVSPSVTDPCENRRFFEDCFESLVGAIYLDKGFEYVRVFSDMVIERYITDDILFNDTNYKGILIQFIRSNKIGTVNYLGGKNEDSTYSICVEINGIKYESCEAKSKKDAEQGASKIVIDKLGLKI